MEINLGSALEDTLYVERRVFNRVNLVQGFDVFSSKLNTTLKGGGVPNSYSLDDVIINVGNKQKIQCDSNDKYLYFINLEHSALLDLNVVSQINLLSKLMVKCKSSIVIVVAEYNPAVIRSAAVEYFLNDAGVFIALDNVTFESAFTLDFSRHEFVKFDFKYVLRRINDVKFVDWLFYLRELGIKIITYNIERKDEYDLARALPFDFFVESTLEFSFGDSK